MFKILWCSSFVTTPFWNDAIHTQCCMKTTFVLIIVLFFLPLLHLCFIVNESYTDASLFKEIQGPNCKIYRDCTCLFFYSFWTNMDLLIMAGDASVYWVLWCDLFLCVSACSPLMPVGRQIRHHKTSGSHPPASSTPSPPSLPQSLLRPLH